MDDTTEYLFSPFHREVGLRRRVIYNKDQFIGYVEENDGRDDCFTSVYPLNRVIDKVFIDIDKNESITFTNLIKETKRFYKWLIDHDYTTIPVASGNKGFHLHILLKPSKYNKPKKKLTSAMRFFIKESGVSNKVIDAHCVGDVRRICRIPNTEHQKTDENYCTYLPREWYKIIKNRSDYIRFTKRKHSYGYKMRSFPTLNDFPECEYETRREDTEEHKNHNIPEDVLKYLKHLLRPCLFEMIQSRSPAHFVRLAVTNDLLNLGLSVSEVVKIFSRLNWVDFDAETTRYYVKKAKEAGNPPFSCKKLRRYGVKRICC